jgi:hypothetical protein
LETIALWTGIFGAGVANVWMVIQIMDDQRMFKRQRKNR